MNKSLTKLLVIALLTLNVVTIFAQKTEINNTAAEYWLDTNGEYINAHGGGIINYNGMYYWFGESKDSKSGLALAGVACYSSIDLMNWTNNGIALAVVKNDTTHDITSGCILERPKVVYNRKTNKFVMWFHLELRKQGYKAARVGLAVSDKIAGPYKFIRSYRPNPGVWPLNFSKEDQVLKITPEQISRDNKKEWNDAIVQGMFTRRDFAGGQMSRDMTIYVDDDGKAYHIYASEENATLNIAQLTEDYQAHNGKYIRVAPNRSNEAPSIFKKDKKYYMITSGCTGWAPNAARLYVADSIMGQWKEYPNPCVGKNAEKTFNGQSTFIMPMPGKKGEFIFMADVWNPRNLKMSGHYWLPIQFENGLPVLKWIDSWKL